MKIEWMALVPLKGECEIIDEVPPGATVTAVNGKNTQGICGACGQPVYLTQTHFVDDDSVPWHAVCP